MEKSLCISEVEKELAKFKSIKEGLKSLDISWDVHLTADVEVDGMEISVKFDAPAPVK